MKQIQKTYMKIVIYTLCDLGKKLIIKRKFVSQSLVFTWNKYILLDVLLCSCAVFWFALQQRVIILSDTTQQNVK